jgi:hypothetical protein
MGDVRLARGAELAEVRLVGEAVGVADAPDVGGVEVVELDGQRRERRGGGVAGRERMGGRGARPLFSPRAWRSRARRWRSA